LAYEIPNAHPLVADLENPTHGAEEERRSLLGDVAAFMAYLHERGVEHKDIHVGNLLVQLRGEGRVIHLIDLKEIRLGAPLSWRRRVRDLARLLLSLHPHLEADDGEFILHAYGAHSGFKPALQTVEPLKEAMEQRRLRSRTARCLQESSNFGRRRRWARSIYFQRNFPLEHLDELVKEARSVETRENSRALKCSPETTLTHHLLGTEGKVWKLCVKRYHPRGGIDRFKYLFRRSRARRSWLAGWGLRTREIPTPLPWVLIEERRYGLPAEGVVIMAYLQGSQPLEQYVQRTFGRRENGIVVRRRRFVEVVAKLVADIHARDILHRDLKGTNLLIQELGERWKISLVDLGHVRFDRSLTSRERALNLAQLNASIPPCIGQTDRWRFLLTYAGGAPREEVRALALEIIETSPRFKWVHDVE
jgi:tRNA A-37 threonylcarbamoyl transferase component Bud32